MNRKIYMILFLLFCFLLTSCTRNMTKQTINEKAEITDKASTTNEVVIPTTKKENIASKIEKDIYSFIPKGWHILEKVEGDLNKDSINDIAAVIEETSESEEEAPSRALLIVFGNKDNTYTFSIKAESAILRADEGGSWGDPFKGISIDSGSILISFYGGSNWRWYGKYRFRYQENDWYLIGATVGSFHTSTNEHTQENDYNLLTGYYIKKKADKNGILKTTKGNRGRRKLLKLNKFIASLGEENILYEE